MSQPTPHVSAAIAHAARTTGVSAAFLASAARRESSFDPDAQAATSSAAGLYQFIESTWLSTVEKHGASYGLDREAAAAADPHQRARVLALRFEPGAASLMAGALALENADALSARLGRAAAPGELYAAHVLGASGAADLIETAAATPDEPAERLHPQAARANRGLFYGASGAPVTARELLSRLTAGVEETPIVTAPEFRGGTRRAAAPPSGGVMLRGGTQPLRLTPIVVEVLASLSTPRRSEADERREDEQNQPLFLNGETLR